MISKLAMRQVLSRAFMLFQNQCTKRKWGQRDWWWWWGALLYNLSFFQKKKVAWCIGVGLVTESVRAPAPRLKNDISWHTLTTITVRVKHPKIRKKNQWSLQRPQFGINKQTAGLCDVDRVRFLFFFSQHQATGARCSFYEPSRLRPLLGKAQDQPVPHGALEV